MSNSTMTPERRSDLIGDTVKQIVELENWEAKLKNHASHGVELKQEMAECASMLSKAKEKLVHLKTQELLFTEKRLETVKREISACEPGQWVDLEGLRGELQAKIVRIRKELGNE